MRFTKPIALPRLARHSLFRRPLLRHRLVRLRLVRHQRVRHGLALLTCLLLTAPLHAGPFPPAAGQPGSTAIADSSPAIVAWASGYSNYLPGGNVDAQFQTPALAVGPAGNSDGGNLGFNFDIVSLGDGGSITLQFSPPIRDDAGFDFAVFENSFSDNFLELAWVEVSSDGSNFTRFEGFSLTASPVGSFGNIDPTDIHQLAGKYRGGFGTPFDLSLLAGTAGLDINAISHVRIVDIKGDGSQTDNVDPPAGPNPIYDPDPTTSSGGFDLDAIAALYVVEPVINVRVPLPATIPWLLLLSLAAIAAGRRRSQN